MLPPGLVSGFGPWVIQGWIQARGEPSPELCQLDSATLMKFVLCYAVLKDMAHQSIRCALDAKEVQP